MLQIFSQLKRRWESLTRHSVVCDLLGKAVYKKLLSGARRQASKSKVRLPATFTDDDLVMVYWYTHQTLTKLTYKSLNAVLRNAPHPSRKKLLEISSHLTIALEKLPSFQGDCWRTSSNDIGQGHQWATGNVVQYSAYMSSSKNPRTWPNLGGTFIFIQSKYGRYIGGISRYPHEEEVLFLPGSEFLVLTNNMSTGIRRLILEEV